MSTYFLALGFYCLAICYVQRASCFVRGSNGWLVNWLATLGFGTSALLVTGGLFGCPVGDPFSNWSIYSQLVGLVGAIPSVLIYNGRA